ncbi:TGF-beta-activated kinase 1 and MAP3K7-binding protein 3 isoform 5-T9 [Alca torda]
MAQGSQQLDVQVLHDLRQRFPEIPEGVVSQCMLQNNNNLDACCRALAQESNKYLYMEYHSPDDTRMNRNSLLHINLGIHPHTSYHAGDGAQLNGGRTLVHSSSDGHIDPQRTAGKQLICLVQEPHSAPAVVAASPSYNPFFMNDQNRNAATPPPQPPPQPSSIQPGMNTSAMQGPPPTYMHIPRLSKGSMNKIEITVEPPQRPGTAMNRSPSPISNQPSQRNQHPLYTATTPPSSSPSRGMSGQPKPPFSVNPVYITYTQPTGPTGAPTQSPRVMVSQPNPTIFKITVGRAPTENLLNLVDQEERSAAPEPIQPISVIPGSGGEKGSHKYQRSSSSGSDDYAYTQALLLHQRARMERLAKELKIEKEELERLKAEVNGMEHDLMQRRLRRVSCTTAIPTSEEMTRLRSLNRQLQINVDCTLKEVDLLQSRGNFDPKATCNFYDNIEPGPVVPPKPYKKEHQNSSKQTPRTQPRDEDFEGAPWNCDSCTFLNHPALNRCEQCEMPR